MTVFFFEFDFSEINTIQKQEKYVKIIYKRKIEQKNTLNPVGQGLAPAANSDEN